MTSRSKLAGKRRLPLLRLVAGARLVGGTMLRMLKMRILRMDRLGMGPDSGVLRLMLPGKGGKGNHQT